MDELGKNVLVEDGRDRDRPRRARPARLGDLHRADLLASGRSAALVIVFGILMLIAYRSDKKQQHRYDELTDDVGASNLSAASQSPGWQAPIGRLCAFRNGARSQPSRRACAALPFHSPGRRIESRADCGESLVLLRRRRPLRSSRALPSRGREPGQPDDAARGRWRSSTTPGTARPRATARGSTGSRTATRRRSRSPRTGSRCVAPTRRRSPGCVRAQMREIASMRRADGDRLVVGPGSTEAARLPRRRASRASGRAAGRAARRAVRRADARGARAGAPRVGGFRASPTPTSTTRRTSPDSDWQALNAQLPGMRLFANTNLPGKAKAGGFAGLYTYDVRIYDGTSFPRMCASARRLGLLCAPSVGPGFDAARATGETRVRSRGNGATYDRMWRGAIRAAADIVTITSYNEWHEGTQIEPAAAVGPPYASYDGRLRPHRPGGPARVPRSHGDVGEPLPVPAGTLDLEAAGLEASTARPRGGGGSAERVGRPAPRPLEERDRDLA